MAETAKAHSRRMRTGFYNEYCRGDGIDIGAGDDPLPTVYGTVVPFDKRDGDAHTVAMFANDTFDYVYSSHCLEHLERPEEALKNWWRILKPGGYLIVAVPHRDLYEKKHELPSRWNHDHKWMFVADKKENSWTLGVRELFDSVLTNHEWIQLAECSEGHTITDPEIHSDGEYQLEAVVKKC